MLEQHNFGTGFTLKRMKVEGLEFDPHVIGNTKPELVWIGIIGPTLDNFVAGRSMIACKDGEPVLLEAI